MFLINNDGADNHFQQLTSRDSFLSSDTLSMSTSSSTAGHPSRPQREMMKALIRDLSFWDAIPPADRKSFPSPLPQKPRIQSLSSLENAEPPRFMLQRGSSASLHDSSRSGSGNKGTIEDQRSSAWHPQPVWKAAVDPTTGRTYYYDAVTRMTQWEKPAEVRQMEKQRRAQRKKSDRQFFQEMEKNILRSLARGEVVPGIPNVRLEPTGPPLEPRNANPLGARNFRTLSRMDDTILAELRDDVITPEEFDRAMSQQTSKRILPRSSNNDTRGRPPLPGQSQNRTADRSRSRSRSNRAAEDNKSQVKDASSGTSRRNQTSSNNQRAGDNPAGPDGLAGEHLLDGPIEAEIQALAVKSVGAMKNHVRRNTGGTIYVNGTMSNPNVDATIKCVCGVYRAHLVQAAEARSKNSPVSVMNKPLDLEIFHDRYHLPSSRQPGRNQDSIPSLSDIVDFYQEFYSRSQMEFDTIIMSLIYVERLIKTTNLTPGPENWRSVLFSCMVLASKVWDDLSMWNIDFSNVASAQSSNQSEGLSLFTLQRVNQLELILLKSLNFDVRVPASEYAKYYFLIRTMLLRSGLLEEAAKPLGKDEAELLENRVSQYQDSKVCSKERGRRVQSMWDYSFMEKVPEGDYESGPALKDAACLEQIVRMN